MRGFKVEQSMKLEFEMGISVHGKGTYNKLWGL